MRKARLHLFGERLADARGELRMSQQDLADAVRAFYPDSGINQGYVSALETGKGERLPSVKTLVALAAATGKLSSYLIGEIDIENIDPSIAYAPPGPDTEEAKEVSDIVDRLPLPRRQEILAFARTVDRADREARLSNERLALQLLDVVEELGGSSLRSQATEILAGRGFPV